MSTTGLWCRTEITDFQRVQEINRRMAFFLCMFDQLKSLNQEPSQKIQKGTDADCDRVSKDTLPEMPIARK